MNAANPRHARAETDRRRVGGSPVSQDETGVGAWPTALAVVVVGTSEEGVPVVRLQQWPSRVVPTTPEEMRQAVLSVFARAHWSDPVDRAVVRELSDWFEAGWCVEAIVVALDRKPDDSRQRPRGKLDLLTFLRRTLGAWYDDGHDAISATTRLDPPRRGQSMESWLRADAAARTATAKRTWQPLSERGEAARRAAMDFARSRRPDPVERIRETEARVLAAMERLGPPGEPVPLAAPARRDQPVQREAEYAGCRSVVEHHPVVRRLVERLAAENRRPTATEMVVLRNAVRDARTQAGLATLEARGAREGEALSADARRILGYLTRTVAADLPLASMLTVLSDGHRNG